MGINNYCYMIFYIIATAYSAVFVNVSFGGVSANVITFSTFFICWLFFIILNYKRIKFLWSLKHDEIKSFFIVNISTLLSWLGMFWCLKMVSASVQSLVYMSIIPLVSCVLSGDWNRISKLTRFSITVIAIFALGIAYLNPTMHKLGFNSQLLGVLLALAAGSCGAVYIIASSKLQKRRNLTSNDLICIRLPLLLIVTFLLSTFITKDLYYVFSTTYMAKIAFLSLVAVIIPVSMLQISIAKIGGVKTSILVPLVPITAMILEWGQGFSVVVLAAVMTLFQCLAIMYASISISKDKASNVEKEQVMQEANNYEKAKEAI